VASSPSSVLSPPHSPLLGREQPRVFTPPLRPLTPATSLGFALYEFSREVLGIELFPWERWLAVHMLELLQDGRLRFRTVLLLVARQNGKSTFLQVLALFFMFVRGVGLVIGTAQNLDIAEEVWAGAVEMAEGVPELATEVENVSRVNGKKALELRGRVRYKVQAASRRGGRGLSGDLVMLDELREHKSWDAWGAITKTTMARPMAMIVGASNAGDAESVVLAHLRRIAHLAVGDPDGMAGDVAQEPVEDDSLAVFEWSAPPGCDLYDRAAWAQANPSLGYGTITERAILAALRTDPESVFRTEVLCQWVEAMAPSAIDPAVWASLADPGAPRGDSPAFGVAVAPDASWSAIAVAWRRSDGTVYVDLTRDQDGILDYRPEMSWLPARVADLQSRWGGSVSVDLLGRALLPDVAHPSQQAQVQAHNALAAAVEGRQLRHGDEPALDTAIRGARWKTVGDGRALDRKGSVDISPLVAAALAVQGVSSTSAEVWGFWE
jgi:hypothetical protein